MEKKNIPCPNCEGDIIIENYLTYKYTFTTPKCPYCDNEFIITHPKKYSIIAYALIAILALVLINFIIYAMVAVDIYDDNLLFISFIVVAIITAIAILTARTFIARYAYKKEENSINIRSHYFLEK